MTTRATRDLTEDELSIFITLELNSNVDGLFEALKTTDGGWVLEAIQKRFEAYNLNVDKKVMIAVLSIGDGVVGMCSKYVDYIAIWNSTHHIALIDWNIFTKAIYPLGIPVL